LNKTNIPLLARPTFFRNLHGIDIERDFLDISHSVVDILADDAGESCYELSKPRILFKREKIQKYFSFYWTKEAKDDWNSYNQSESTYYPYNNPLYQLQYDWQINSDALIFRNPITGAFVNLIRLNLTPIFIGELNSLPIRSTQTYIYQQFEFLNTEFLSLMYLFPLVLYQEREKATLLYNNIYTPLEEEPLFEVYYSWVFKPLFKFILPRLPKELISRPNYNIHKYKKYYRTDDTKYIFPDVKVIDDIVIDLDFRKIKNVNALVLPSILLMTKIIF